jgi:hypothetical protein
MWTRKKIAIIAISAAVLLVGITGGVVLAQDNGNSNSTQAPPQAEDLLAKVVTIYQQNTGVTIDEAQLKTAFDQAQSQIQLAREQTMVQNLVKNGKLTQDQADQYLKWLQSRPSLPSGFGKGFGPGFGGCFGGRGGPAGPPPQAPSTTQ